jgi:hypothetical protein
MLSWNDFPFDIPTITHTKQWRYFINKSNLNFKINLLFVLNCKIRNKQLTIEHNFIKYSYSYMFRTYRVFIRMNLLLLLSLLLFYYYYLLLTAIGLTPGSSSTQSAHFRFQNINISNMHRRTCACVLWMRWQRKHIFHSALLSIK